MRIFGRVVDYLKISAWATYMIRANVFVYCLVWRHNLHCTIASILSTEKARLLSSMAERLYVFVKRLQPNFYTVAINSKIISPCNFTLIGSQNAEKKNRETYFWDDPRMINLYGPAKVHGIISQHQSVSGPGNNGSMWVSMYPQHLFSWLYLAEHPICGKLPQTRFTLRHETNVSSITFYS